MWFLFLILFILFLTLFLVYKDKDKIKTRRINTIKKGLDKLYAEKRIDAKEYQDMMGVPVGKQEHVTTVAVSKQQDVSDTKVTQPQESNKDLSSSTPGTTRGPAQARPTESTEYAEKEARSEYHVDQKPHTRRQKKKFSGLNALMIAGVIFILLSGAIFVSTTWVHLPAIARLIVMCSFSVLFFSTSVLADKALGIRKTSLAFYTIASVFLPITVVAAGFFNLFGNYLSTSGEGHFLLYMIAAIVLGVPCFIGAKKYMLAYFSEAFLYCISLAYVFLILAFKPTANVFVLLMLFYAAGWVIAGNIINKMGGKTETIILRRIPLFSMVNALAIAIVGAIVLDMGWGGLMLLSFSPLFLTALFNKNSVYWGTLPFAMLLVFGFGRLYTGEFFINYIWMQIITVFVLAVMSGVPVFDTKRRQWFSAIVFVFSCIVFSVQFFNLIINLGWTFSQLMLVAALFLCVIFIAFRNKEKYFLYVFPILTVTIIFGAADLIQSDLLSWGWRLVLFSSLSFVAVMILDKNLKWSPRTALYDVFLTGCCAVGVIAVSTSSVANDAADLLLTTLSFSVLLGMLTAQAVDKKPERSPTTAFFIPPVFFLGSIPVYLYFNKEMNGQWVFLIYLAIVAGGSLWTYAQRNKSKVLAMLELSCFIVLWVASMTTALSLSGESGVNYIVPGTALIWTVFLFCRVAQMAKEKYIDSRKGTFFIFSLWFVLSLYYSSMVTAYYWMNIREVFWILLFPTCLALLIFSLLPAFKFSGKALPVIFCYMPKIASWSLSIFSALVMIFYIQLDSKVLISVVYGVIIFSLLIQYHVKRAYIFAWFEVLLLTVTSIVLLEQMSERLDRQWIGILIFGVQFFVLAGLGRLLHKKVFDVKEPSSVRLGKSIDWLTLSCVHYPLILLVMGQYARWSAFILFGVYSLSFINRVRARSGHRVAMTFAGFFAMFIFWFQPYFSIPDRVNTEYNLIIFIMYFVFLYRWVWKGKVSALLLYLSVCFSFLILAIAAMVSGSVIDALIIGGAALVMIVLSFIFKRKRWFTLSFVVLLFLGFYITRGLWFSVAWWLYLLFVGFLLIGMAAVNEVSKQRGEGLGKKAKKFIDKWK